VSKEGNEQKVDFGVVQGLPAVVPPSQSEPLHIHVQHTLFEYGAEIESRIIDGLRQRAISFKAMPRWLSVMCWGVIFQVIIVGLLLATKVLFVPDTIIDTTGNDAIEVASPIFVVCFLSSLLAWTCAIAGALDAHWSIGIIVLAIFTFAFGGKPIGGLITQVGQLDHQLIFMSIIQTIIIGGF
jgi:hypothetical protein